MGRSKARNMPIDPRQVYWKYADQFKRLMDTYSAVAPHVGKLPRYVPRKSRMRFAGQPPIRNWEPDKEQSRNRKKVTPRIHQRIRDSGVLTRTKKKRKLQFGGKAPSGKWYKHKRNGFISIKRHSEYGKTGSKTFSFY